MRISISFLKDLEGKIPQSCAEQCSVVDVDQIESLDANILFVLDTGDRRVHEQGWELWLAVEEC